MIRYKKDLTISKDEKGFDVFIPKELLDSKDEYKNIDPFDIENNTESDFHKNRVNCTIELLESAVKKFSKPLILDIGCGQGHITAKVKEKFPESVIAGLDHSVTGITEAVKKCSGCEFIVADAFDLPFEESSFDIVLCNNMFEHIDSHTILLSEVRRVLKKDGFFIVSTPNRFKFANILRILRGKPTGKIPKYHITEYTYGQMSEIFRFCGFEIVKTLHKKTHLQKTFHRFMYRIIGSYLKLMKSDYHLDNTSFFLTKHFGENENR